MRYTKILLFLLVATIQAFAAWTGGTSEPESTRKIGGKIFYEITTPEELAWFALQVNSGSTAINAVLANDIVFGRDTASLASVSWIPIGKDTSTAFEGVLDGRGFAIYGMKVQDSSTKATDTLNLGLFGVIARDGWVQNLSLQRASVYTNDSVSNVGLIAGYSRGNLRNISAAGSVTSAKGDGHGGSAGGIAGRASGVMDSVSFMGDSVQSKRYVGGIVGYATDSLTISNSTNTGAVSTSSYSSSYSYSGGFVGYVSSNSTVAISNSTNAGAVSANSTSSYSYSHSDSYSGGFVGGANGTVTISNSTNTGAVSANSTSYSYSDSYSGGFVGGANGTVTISHSTNAGAVSANSTSYSSHSHSYSGGFVGDANGTVTISHSTNAGAVSANSSYSYSYSHSYSGGFVGYASSNSTVTISHSTNAGKVSANSSSSYSYSHSSYSYSGGFVGYASSNSTVTISNSTNAGAVSANSTTTNSSSYSGGFVGYASSNSTVTISNSTNAGAVSANSTSYSSYSSYSHSDSYSGGFVGFVGDVYYSSTVTISSSQNSGNITGTVSTSSSNTNLSSYVGGFVGLAYKGQILDSYNTGSVRAKDTSAVSPNSSYRHLLYAGGLAGYLSSAMTIKNAYSAADSVSYSFKTSNSYTVGYAGALVGLSEGSLQNVYFDSELLSLAAIGRDSSASKINVGGFSTANMQRDLFAWQLNSTGGTEENSKIWSRNGGYPIFADAQNKAIYKVVFDDEGVPTNRYSNNKGVVQFP
ncbi:MAG: GLUG motif-containing protein, partial [Fibrobacter intestinalis]|uniref:GLUG motif-containing protein n=1 Tax=Fibrobacter intestinalis TaxID=28122 RepID=UPI003F0E0998